MHSVVHRVAIKIASRGLSLARSCRELVIGQGTGAHG